jgi:glutaminyl-tRNA synthetase
LEFEDHRPLYDWFIDHVSAPSQPRQYEYSRLNLDYTVLSKRWLNALVTEGYVNGWDDPRMPTISGMRRRGYTPASIRDFCERIGVTKQENRIELSLLENCVRENLDGTTPRAFAVLRPLKIVIENYPEDMVEEVEAPVHPKDPNMGVRKLPFSREIYIDRDDFMEDPPNKFFRLGPGREVRLRFAYIIKCENVVKNAVGEVVELRCSYDPTTRSSDVQSNRKVKGVIHWLSAAHAIKAEIRLYDRLFKVSNPGSEDFEQYLNPDSVERLTDAWVEPGLADVPGENRFQFERLGYFCTDRFDSRPGQPPVFNRTVTLRDSWVKEIAK